MSDRYDIKGVSVDHKPFPLMSNVLFSQNMKDQIWFVCEKLNAAH